MTSPKKQPAANTGLHQPKAAAAHRSDRKTAGSEDYGVEGSNKTIAEPQEGATPSDELAGTPTKNIPGSPFKSRTL